MGVTKAAGNYDEFRTGRTFSASTFRLMETPIVKSSTKYLYKQYRYYSPTQEFVKCCRFTWWDDTFFLNVELLTVTLLIQPLTRFTQP